MVGNGVNKSSHILSDMICSNGWRQCWGGVRTTSDHDCSEWLMIKSNVLKFRDQRIEGINSDVPFVATELLQFLLQESSHQSPNKRNHCYYRKLLLFIPISVSITG